MSTPTVNDPNRALEVMGHVTVKCPVSVGCRPRTRPEGVIVERNSAGLYRVQFEDGSKQWFTEQELSVS